MSQLDDIAFKLAKYDVLGKALRNAAMSAHFRVEFERKPFAYRKRMTRFVKCLYVFNLVVFAVGNFAVAFLQRSGYFQCKSITAIFGEDIWERAYGRDGEHEVLVYSYFNGIYVQDGTQYGRPVYREMRKSDGTPFDTKTGAEIRYCAEEGAWIFTHPDIRKSADEEESSCPWLLRSPDTEAYDLLEVTGDWHIWVGTINKGGQLSVTCNGCKTNTDCNLNGKCVDGECDCSGTSWHEGIHCEHEKPCDQIMGDMNDTWSLLHKHNCEPLREYGRPVYALTNYDSFFASAEENEVADISDDDLLVLVFSGARWFVMKFDGEKNWTHKNDQLARRGLEYRESRIAVWCMNSLYTCAIHLPSSRCARCVLGSCIRQRHFGCIGSNDEELPRWSGFLQDRRTRRSVRPLWSTAPDGTASRKGQLSLHPK